MYLLHFLLEATWVLIVCIRYFIQSPLFLSILSSDYVYISIGNVFVKVTIPSGKEVDLTRLYINGDVNDDGNAQQWNDLTLSFTLHVE